MTDSGAQKILIAEDEADVAEGYKLWLGPKYNVEIAVDGQEALDRIDEGFDVILLDRMMPEVSGKDVLQEIRDRGIDCRVVMVTAVEPDFDVIEMGFDAYITKPPERGELIDTVDRLLERGELDEEMQEYYSLMARRGSLEAQKSQSELDESEAYQELLDRIDRIEAEVDEGLGDLTEEIDFVSVVRELEEDSEDFAMESKSGDIKQDADQEGDS